jgi:tRNA threonylcarbamoyladenosine biosynthesis protein TsaB
MPKVLGIETTGAFCSVALFNESRVIASKINKQANSHSSILHLLIQELLQEQHIKPSDLDAIALSSGPGSYTGLRIGSSSAKGLAIATGAKLISIPTHYGMLFNPTLPNDTKAFKHVICLTDARRNDVFATAYSLDKDRIGKTAVLDLTDELVQTQLNHSASIIIGSGAEKAEALLSPIHLYLKDDALHAANLFEPSTAKFANEEFEPLYDFGPLYEKEFYTNQKVSK